MRPLQGRYLYLGKVVGFHPTLLNLSAYANMISRPAQNTFCSPDQFALGGFVGGLDLRILTELLDGIFELVRGDFNYIHAEHLAVFLVWKELNDGLKAGRFRQNLVRTLGINSGHEFNVNSCA